MSIYLSRIGIQDFRTFGSFEVAVPATPSLVLLTGTNGLGKSSFFDAIEWGLTGTIRRFTPYLKKGRKKLVERDYLTRRGAEPGSHKVELTFSDGDPIVRGADMATPMSSIIAKLARPERLTIDDLSTYLALTHFLGQAAQQRFTSREPEDQWQALKGPSGIERLEQIRAGLRGRPTVTAFTRRLEREEGVVAMLERQTADWQGLSARLDRLRQAVRATGILTVAEVEERVDALEAALSGALGGAAIVISGETVSKRLASLGDRLGDALRDMTARLDGLESLEDMPATFAAASAEARLDHPVLVRLRQAVSDARAELVRLTPGIDPAEKAVADQTAAIATIERNITLLDAARADLIRRKDLEAQITTAKDDRTETATAIAARRASVAEADRSIGRHGDAVAEVARLRTLAQSARAVVDSLSTLLDLEAESGRLASSLAAAHEAASAAATTIAPLNEDVTARKAQIAVAVQARAEAERHATAISAALAQLASHIHDDETDCPVCRSTFKPGVLKSLAEAAASASDDRLASADEELESLRADESALTARVASLEATIGAPSQIEREASAAADAVTNARAALARTLEVDPANDLSAAARTRERGAAVALADAEAALEPLVATAAAATEQRATLSADLEDLIARETQVSARLDNFMAEDQACVDRLTARGLTDSTFESVEGRLSGQRGQLEAARARLAGLVEAAAALTVTVEGARTGLTTVERELSVAESARAAAEATTQEMSSRWIRAGIDGSPSQATLDRTKAVVADALNALRSLAEQQQALAKDNEDALLQGEVNQVLAAMRQAGGDAGIADPTAYLAGLEAKAKAARAAVKLTTAARTAVRHYTEELKIRSDDFSNRVLDPLNVVIDDFNEAMLSTPGETIQFKADTRVDATSFGMSLRYREQLEHAIETPKDLPPQVVLSEGQLAANGFSILCAASTAYPWSNWRALLLDDPLQHNDIIHTAAFVDVMRNMVELDGYQLVMSSHDRGESDFIARKFDAAGLPCTTILLTAPSEKGVVWEPPLYNQVANRFLRQSSDQRQSDSA